MNSNQLTQLAKDVEELFTTVMELYWRYLDALETLAKNIPPNETELFNGLLKHIEEVQKALEHDIGVFADAAQKDKEELGHLKDQLKINDIYNKLKNG